MTKEKEFLRKKKLLLGGFDNFTIKFDKPKREFNLEDLLTEYSDQQNKAKDNEINKLLKSHSDWMSLAIERKDEVKELRNGIAVIESKLKTSGVYKYEYDSSNLKHELKQLLNPNT